MQWYYIENGERLGPIEEDELRGMIADGRLDPDALVWNETMGEEWAEIRSVPGLAVSPPPSLPQEEARVEALPPGEAVLMPPPLDADDDEDLVYGGPVSCTQPVSRAWNRMVRILFSPFDFGKWFALGVSAWLATLGEGGVSPSFNIPGGSGTNGSPDPAELLENAVEGVRSAMDEIGGVLIAVIVIVVAVFFALGLVFMWLNSRGKLMFLDNVVKDSAEVGEAWRDTARLGNSLFRWNLVYGFICFLITAILIVAIVFAIVMPCVRIKGFAPGCLPAAVILGMVWIVFAIVASAIGRFRDDFVVPIMYGRDEMCTAAWGHFMEMLRGKVGTFVLYLLFRFVLTLGAQMALGLLTVITCCIAGCLFAIPYIGAVAMLPVIVFFRAYSLEYLAQFDKEYRLFTWR